jgi:HAD superfamily hydrolase (TIGR01509 family)
LIDHGGWQPKAIIFDMDGLLVDSETVWWEAENEILLQYGVTLEPEVRSKLTGLRNDEFIGQLRQIYGIPASHETLHNAVIGRLLELIPQKVKPMPGARDIIMWASENHMPVAIASSSPMVVIEAIIESQQWSRLIPIRCTAEDLPKGKPAPDVYLKAAELIGISPQACLALEDSPNGARAAVAAGMICYVVPDLSHTRWQAFEGITEYIFDDLRTILYQVRKLVERV